MFADAAAKAEFHLRCQKSDPQAVEAWLSGHCDQCWEAFQRKNPALVGSDKEALIAEARNLIVRNWDHVMTMASAYAHSGMDVEGRENEFLDKVYYEPDAMGGEQRPS